jgi:BON domain
VAQLEELPDEATAERRAISQTASSPRLPQSRTRPPSGSAQCFYNDDTLKVNEINVETFKGVVQLSGFVRSQADIDQAVKVAREVAGVKSVKNDMRLK